MNKHATKLLLMSLATITAFKSAQAQTFPAQRTDLVSQLSEVASKYGIKSTQRFGDSQTVEFKGQSSDSNVCSLQITNHFANDGSLESIDIYVRSGSPSSLPDYLTENAPGTATCSQRFLVQDQERWNHDETAITSQGYNSAERQFVSAESLIVDARISGMSARFHGANTHQSLSIQKQSDTNLALINCSSSALETTLDKNGKAKTDMVGETYRSVKSYSMRGCAIRLPAR